MVGFIAYNPHAATAYIIRSVRAHRYATFIFSCRRGCFQYFTDLSSLDNDSLQF